MSLLLLDTHLLLWAATGSPKLPRSASDLLVDKANALAFSIVSLWEVVIKAARGRPDFRVDARQLRRGLLDAAYRELAIEAAHVLAVARLPPLHRDPFDRLLVAQAESEGATLLTADATVARYGGAVRMVG